MILIAGYEYDVHADYVDDDDYEYGGYVPIYETNYDLFIINSVSNWTYYAKTLNYNCV